MTESSIKVGFSSIYSIFTKAVGAHAKHSPTLKRPRDLTPNRIPL